MSEVSNNKRKIDNISSSELVDHNDVNNDNVNIKSSKRLKVDDKIKISSEDINNISKIKKNGNHDNKTKTARSSRKKSKSISIP